MDRLKTYVEGFDEALGGGIPRGSLVLVAGTPGTMKTALTFSILYENVKAGSKALYITLEESQEDLRAAMTDLGMTGLDDMELYILDVGRIRLEHKDEEPTKNWLDVLQKYIDQRGRVNTFDLIALDSLAALYSLSHLHNPSRALFHFFGFLNHIEEPLGGLPGAFLVANRFVRPGFFLLARPARLPHPLQDVFPGPPPEQGGDRRASPRHHDEPADRKMRDVRTFRPPFGFP